MNTTLLLGAKSQTTPLESIPAELSQLKQLMKTHQPSLNLEYEPYLTRDLLATLLTEHSNQVNALHFAGHSDAERLETNDEMIYAHHIAKIIRTWQQKPSLIFLNGCNNAQQINDFHNAGVSCIIATHKAINDDFATHFAREFYKNLFTQSDKTTYQQAFDRAGALTLMNQQRNVRSIDLEEIDTYTNGWDWGIYSNPAQPDFAHTQTFAQTQSAPEPPIADFITQSKLKQAQERWIRISDWIAEVMKQYDTETRVEEKMRIQHTISGRQDDLEQVEAEITELTNKLNGA